MQYLSVLVYMKAKCTFRLKKRILEIKWISALSARFHCIVKASNCIDKQHSICSILRFACTNAKFNLKLKKTVMETTWYPQHQDCRLHVT